MKLTSFVSLVAASLLQTSCVAAGYTSDGGWFFWPGGVVGLLVIVVLAFLFLRRRM